MQKGPNKTEISARSRLSNAEFIVKTPCSKVPALSSGIEEREHIYI